ncbi:hypothetical protein [Streptomyces fuscigenes]|uniref:hypothetical protein n=1 Tax=Streptomyces fuscigenes TaxID=1528880 RepID=UPI001F1D7D08|nr:hypothetical protein [Streptomyces fuscigenes]MCF3960601.1 hypothetical protein [Streptomyces fuscigenes]
MARCGCGGGQCACTLTAGDNILISGTGSAANPFRVSADVPCETVRACFTAGPGIDLDEASGTIAADLSGQAGNNLTIGPDGGLLVPTAGGSVLTGCGLTGNGSASSPVKAATGTWPYACSPEEAGTVIACGTDGVLRGEPRGVASWSTFGEERSFPDTAIATGNVVIVDNYSATVTNPSTCNPAMVLVEEEVDMWMVLPAGAGAATGFDSDETFYMRNTGTSTMTGVHAQATKFLSRGMLAPGATVAVGFGASAGKATGGAYYYRINYNLRVFLLAL